MRVAVTGAGGRLGSATLQAAREQGMEVVYIDRVPTRDRDTKVVIADLSDLGQVYHAVAGCDAILHLGAIPSPTGRPPEVVYRNNVLADFHVFEAAATLGIRRVVHASSVSALGFPYQFQWSEPLYFPVDEDHPLIPQDAYGLSKAAGEDIGAAYCRRGAGSAAGLRFSLIMHADMYPSFMERARRDPAGFANILWSYVDLRDAVAACLLALNAPFEGYHPLFITAADVLADLDAGTLLDRYFPTVPRRTEVIGKTSLISGARAREVLGYQPRYAWREMLA